MNKSFVITFSVSVIILATATVVMLMILLPKQLVSLKTSVETYNGIEKSNFTYVKTKDISKEALLKEYKISNADMNEFKNKYKYVYGNSDPFYREEKKENNSSTSTGGTASGNTNNTTNSSQTTTDKITNSNGGIKNPESTNK